MEIVQEKFPGNPEELEVFRSWLEILNCVQILYLLAGAFAMCLHTGAGATHPRRQLKD